MKKIVIQVVIFLLVFSPVVMAFSDTENHWASDEIDVFQETMLIKGYGNDLFKPDNYMTRAEAVTIINRMNGITKESQKYVPDIKRKDWYYSEIRKAIISGVIQGDENGYTNPDKFVTREEIVVMLQRAFYIDNTTLFNNSFDDNDEISSWSIDAVNTFASLGYINGYEDNTFRPKNNITRAEFITIVNRMFEKIATAGIYRDIINGNVIVIDGNVVLNNIVISRKFGDC